MIKKVEGEMNGTKEMSEKHFIDAKILSDYLENNIDAYEGPLNIEEFIGGQSNPTYLLKTPSASYVLRRKPPGNLLKSAHAVDREYRVISALNNTNVPVPKAYLHCEDESLIGTEFFVMEFINGSVIWDPDIPHGTNSDRTQIYESMNKTIKRLHKVDPIKIGLEDFGKPGNYVGRQVARWSKQYELSETEKIPAMDSLIQWLPKNLPSEKPTRLVHGDFSLTNVIVNNDSNEIASILDWELSTLGDPIADFSYHCLRYLDNPVLSNEQECLRLGIPTYKNYVKMYFEGSDFDIKPDEWNLYMAFNMFKIAAILQGITGRVRDGTAAGKDADKLFPQTVELATNAWKLINSN